MKHLIHPSNVNKPRVFVIMRYWRYAIVNFNSQKSQDVLRCFVFQRYRRICEYLDKIIIVRDVLLCY